MAKLFTGEELKEFKKFCKNNGLLKANSEAFKVPVVYVEKLADHITIKLENGRTLDGWL